MAALFSTNPALNETKTIGQRTWKFNGTAWKLVPRNTDAVAEGSNNLYFTNARVAAAPAVSALESRAGAIESDLQSEESARIAGDNALDQKITTEKGRIDAILDASQADKNSFKEIVDLINSVDTENDSAFAGYVSSNNARVAATEGRLDTAESDIIALEGRATTLESDVDAAEGRLTTAESDIDSLESRATTLETDLATAESNIGALQSGKQIKNVTSDTAPSHVEGLRWIDSTDMSEYLSYNGAWIELDRV